ncbi:MAG: hypothetical protein ACLVJK_02835 [Alistipes putredinis]
MLRVHISKQSVFKGEPLLATFKLYRRVAIVGYEDIKFPSFNGFWTQDIDVSNAMWQRETLNGKVYESTVVKRVSALPAAGGYARDRTRNDHRHCTSYRTEPPQYRSVLWRRARSL